MIEVVHLTKRYPGRVAVDDVSFDVGRGEIVGFLGPNGAGKTTTMRVLTGYLPPTGGTVRVAGYDVVEEGMSVRRRIGYLPEHCPLYPEMRVDEYLRFRGLLKGLRARRVRARLDEVKQLCGLIDVGRRIIGQLSKGYRQRVGLAESLIHDPELLILDEPTIGLDPNQIRQVRELITNLAQKHTILISTHILQEVEAICRRVLIINRGRIVASDTTENLHRRLQGGVRVIAEIRGSPEDVAEALRALPKVQQVAASADGEWRRYELLCDADADPRAEVFAAVARGGWSLRELSRERQSLEAVFVSLTSGPAAGGTRG
jgi:ABC-2 type transport system ATP-binding protein